MYRLIARSSSTAMECSTFNPRLRRLIANTVIYYNTLLLSRVYAQKQAAGDYAVAEIVKDISPNAWQHVHLIGAFDFEQTESQIDIDALAARYDDPDFWNRPLVEAPDDSLTQPLDRTFTVLERWAFLSNVDERFRRLRRIQIWRPQVARLPLDASIRFTQTGAARINTVRKIRRVRHGLQPLRVGNPNRSSGGLRSP